ncbi:MAG: hypothetical protein AAF557_11155 [Pseudomonadota bacterium]
MSQLATIAAWPSPETQPERGRDFSDSHLKLLNFLRLSALRCRCSARQDVAEACRAFAPDQMVSQSTYSELLVKSLTQFLGRPPRFFSPGNAEISNEEAWLLRLMTCQAEGDRLSAAFLMRSRVPAHARYTLSVLIGAVSSAFLN